MTTRSLLSTLVAAVALLPAVTAAMGANIASAVVLVATDAGTETLGETVVLAVPLVDGRHFGFILNQPTDTPLAALFPEEEACRKVSAAVHIGGPEYTDSVFAVVRERATQANKSHLVTPELSIALDAVDVDRVISERAADARFFVGMVVWPAGELEEAISAHEWQVMAPDPDLVLSGKPGSLWSRLAELARFRNVDGEAFVTRARPALDFAPTPAKPNPSEFPRGYVLRRG